MANLAFKQGLWSEGMFGDSVRSGSSIKNFSEGTIYVVTDQKAIYLDTYQNKAASAANQKRIRLQGTVQYYESVTAWSESVTPPYNSDVIYFIADKNAFMRYDSVEKKWVQLNTTAKTANDLLGLIEGNQKAIGDLGDRVDAIETAIGGTGSGTSILDRLSQAEADINAVEEKNTTQDNRLKNIEDTLGNTQNPAGETTVLGRLKEAEGNIDQLGTTTGNHSELLEVIGGTDGKGGEIKKLADRATAVEGRASTLEGKMTTAEGKITNLENALNNTSTGVLKRLSDIEAENETQGNNIANHGELLAVIGGTDGKGGEVKKLADRASSLEGKMTTAEGKITNLENAIGSDNVADSIKGRIHALEDTASTHTSEISGLGDRVEINENDIKDLKTNKVNVSTYEAKISSLEQKDVALTQSLNGLSTDFQAASKDHSDRLTSIEGRMADAEGTITSHGTEITNIKSAASTLTGRVGAVEGVASNNASEISNIKSAANTLAGRVTAAEGNITALQTALDEHADYAEETYATKVALNDAKTELQGNIDSHIKAANAMVYKGGVTSWADLNTKATNNTDLSIGQTYIATSNFTDTKDGYDKVYAGDILVATGTENANGKLTASNVTWVHVSSGYVEEHMPKITIDEEDGIVLTSLNGEGTSGDLGSIGIESTSDNITVTLDGDNNKISVGLVWDTF